jgi:arginine utilization protein RocB
MLAAQDWLSIAQQSQVEVFACLQGLVRVPSVNGCDGEATVAPRVAA